MSDEGTVWRSSKIALLRELWSPDASPRAPTSTPLSAIATLGDNASLEDVLAAVLPRTRTGGPELSEALEKLVREHGETRIILGASIVASAFGIPLLAAKWLSRLSDSIASAEDQTIAAYAYAVGQVAKKQGDHRIANDQLREAVASDPHRLEYAIDLAEHLESTASSQEAQDFAQWASGRHPEEPLFRRLAGAGGSTSTLARKDSITWQVRS